MILTVYTDHLSIPNTKVVLKDVRFRQVSQYLIYLQFTLCDHQ